MLNIKFHGAAQTTTGSAHIIEWDGKNILLDCGTFQGHRKEAFEINRKLPLPPSEISAVILSHSHIDHSGNIPTLVRQGYRGPIYTTPATRDLCDIMLRDSAYLQERDVELVNRRRIKDGKVPFDVLYNEADVVATMSLMKTVEYGHTFEILPGLRATLNDAGHILGSSTVTLDYLRGGKQRRFLFTGDLGQGGMPILRNPVSVPNVNVLVTESTYGDRLHPSKDNVTGRLKDYITFIIQHRSKLIIPAFSVGRTQQILFFLDALFAANSVPKVPVFVDSPLSRKATKVYSQYTNYFNDSARSRFESGGNPLSFSGLHFSESVEDSKALNNAKGPMIIISASGMCEGGRILHHLANNIGNPLNIILIVGFQAENTLGRRIVDRAEKIKILGDEYELKASVYTINALSGHADRAGLLNYCKSLGSGVQHVFCVHGEPEYCRANAEQIKELGIARVDIPVQGQRFENI